MHNRERQHQWRDRVKRATDLILSAWILLLLSPVMLILAATIMLSIGWPVIFRQLRPGLGGKPFELMKFRTMTNARDSSGRLLPDEMRMTRFGRWLRSTSLDELPELINVLRGDMSLVGPRPLLMEYLSLYTATQARRHEVRPGISGWAQVNGRNAIEWSEKLALDVWYIDNRSLGLDLRILWRTVMKVVLAEGISRAGHATIPKFTGTER